MRSFSVVLTLLFAFAATSYAWPSAFSGLEVRKAHGNGTAMNRGDSTKKECRQMQRLTQLEALANNQTKLDELVAKGKMNAEQVAALKTKAADEKSKLATLSANSTLTSQCAIINANDRTMQDCREMKRLEKFTKMANNQTALDAFATRQRLNSTQVDALKARVQKAETKLQQLSSNSTLTQLCAQRKQEKGTGTRNSKYRATSTKRAKVLTDV